MEAKTHDVALLTTATVLSPLFLPPYPITSSLMGEVTAPSQRLYWEPSRSTPGTSGSSVVTA